MTPWVSVRVDAKPVQQRMTTARAVFDRMLAEGLRRTVELAASYAKTSTLYRSHTYGLRQSIKGLVVGGFGGVAGAGGGPMGRVIAAAPYAGFVEAGTAPHIILPRRRKVLRFEQNGVIRFARGVFHPGTEPRPFMAEAATRTMPFFERMMAEAVVRAFA